MSFKYRLLIILYISGVAFFPHFVKAEEAKKEIALIYATSSQEITEDVQILYELLSVYANTDILAAQDIQQELLTSYERIVLVNFYPMELPNEAIRALNNFQGPAVVIGDSALQLDPFAGWHDGEKVKLLMVGEQVLTNPLYWQAPQLPTNVEVIQTASSFSTDYPFIVKIPNSNWSHIALFTKELIYEWSVTISQLLQLPQPTNHEAFIVLSDINMRTNVDHLAKLVTTLKEHEIPVILEVAPFADENGTQIYLDNNEELVSYLQKLQQEEAVFILASFTETVERSLHYLVRNNIYPTLLNGDSQIFNHLVQHRPFRIYPSEQNQQFIFPYTVRTELDGSDNPLYRMEQTIEQLLNIPGAIISFQYPSYLEPDYLIDIVNFMKSSNLKWINFGEKDFSVLTKNVSIAPIDEEGRLHTQLSFSIFERLSLFFDNNPFEFGLWILVITVGLFVAIFFINTLRLRITLRKRLFEERKYNG
ncbi:DUF2334 domain-containing protein [Metasolibacillus meyeri]|uniref:DUF2334 domain-containing protein n=1 Tax=Metasolibacillus meyeri TaxID=1071052 RepID=A0AAW9NRW9_9BACL|nr:DUF2334 domain-containing protein [Metasolibacillus meyeri]MEC1178693.1 DUF2334 domain-containing protein [Metasolibacillus meyeri]